VSLVRCFHRLPFPLVLFAHLGRFFASGPITVFNKTIFNIIDGLETGPDYLQFIGWVYLWAAILHWVFALWQGCRFLKYVTRFSCDTFGFYVS